MSTEAEKRQAAHEEFAYGLGRMAYTLCRTTSDCPYKAGSKSADAWHRGWGAGHWEQEK